MFFRIRCRKPIMVTFFLTSQLPIPSGLAAIGRIRNNLTLMEEFITTCVGVNVFDENWESHFICPFNHPAQEKRTATDKNTFTGGNINATLAQEVVKL